MSDETIKRNVWVRGFQRRGDKTPSLEKSSTESGKIPLQKSKLNLRKEKKYSKISLPLPLEINSAASKKKI